MLNADRTPVFWVIKFKISKPLFDLIVCLFVCLLLIKHTKACFGFWYVPHSDLFAMYDYIDANA